MLFHECLLIQMWNLWSWFDEELPSVWWLTAVCGWLCHLTTYLALLTPNLPPADGTHNTVTHFYAFLHTSLGSSAPSIVVQLANHCCWQCLNCDITCLTVEQEEVSACTYVHNMCTQMSLCRLFLQWLGMQHYVCIHIRIRYYLSASCARHTRPTAPCNTGQLTVYVCTYVWQTK